MISKRMKKGSTDYPKWTARKASPSISSTERVKERIRTESVLNKGSVFPVQPATNEDNISDNRAFVRASAQAQKAADYILNRIEESVLHD